MGLFRVDGKIRLVCSERDLEARLIGTAPERFLKRPDVEFLLGSDDFTLLDDEPDPADDVVAMLEQAMVERARKWCFANGQQPHPLLPGLIGAAVEAMVQGLPDELDLDANGEIEALLQENEGVVSDQMAAFLAASFHDDPAGCNEAMRQLISFMASTGTPEQFLQELDLVD